VLITLDRDAARILSRPGNDYSLRLTLRVVTQQRPPGAPTGD
jgi:hypothetical protein